MKNFNLVIDAALLTLTAVHLQNQNYYTAAFLGFIALINILVAIKDD